MKGKLRPHVGLKGFYVHQMLLVTGLTPNQKASTCLRS